MLSVTWKYQKGSHENKKSISYTANYTDEVLQYPKLNWFENDISNYLKRHWKTSRVELFFFVLVLFKTTFWWVFDQARFLGDNWIDKD